MENRIIQWSDALGAGIVWMDYQHQQLIEKINELYTAIVQRKVDRAIIDVIVFLDQYVAHHFGLEEAYMKKFGYPQMGEHCQAHDDFKKNLRELRSQLDMPRELISESLCYDLYEWFKSHITTTDAKLGLFVKSKLVI